MIGLINKGLDMIGGAMSGLQQMGKGLATGNPMEFLQGFKKICESAMQAMPQANQGGGGGGGCPGLSMNPMDMLRKLFGGGGGQEGVSNTPGGGENGAGGSGGGNPMQALNTLIHDLGKMQLSLMSLGMMGGR
jgi:hypothetical protein